VGRWKFDLNAKDSSGNQFDGNVVGTPTYVIGEYGQALQLNGTTDSVNFGDIGNVNTSGMTITFWVNYSALPGVWASPIQKAVGGGAGEFQYAIGADGTGGNISLSTSNATLQSNGLCKISLAGKTGRWIHYAFAWSATGSFCQAYENGSLAASQSTSIYLDPSATHPLLFGGLGYLSDAPFQGALDDVRIYDRVLTGAEIQSVLSSGE
jgi:hypothetical protein